jgi:hypothetical protein
MRNKLIYIFIIILIICSCEPKKDPKVIVSEKKFGFVESGHYFADVTLKNVGGIPAYFVILIATAYTGGNEIQRVERGYGDLFPNGEKSFRIIFDKYRLNPPDTVNFEITFSHSISNSVAPVGHDW